MEVSQFTYFQQVCGIECAPVSGELTYGLERLAMYVQGVDNVYDLNFNGREGDEKVTYGEVFLQAEQEYSRHNFEFADTQMLLRHFDDAEAECKALLDAGAPAGNANNPLHQMVLPAYDQTIKASHVFNLLDARGVISVTERQSYILRVRNLAKACGEAFLKTEAGGRLGWGCGDRRLGQRCSGRCRRLLPPSRWRCPSSGGQRRPTRARRSNARERVTSAVRLDSGVADNGRRMMPDLLARTSQRRNPRAHAAQGGGRPAQDGHRRAGRGRADL